MATGLSAQGRIDALEAARPHDSPEPFSAFAMPFVWSDEEMHRLRLAFAVRFDEQQPRSETLLKVAAEGIRIYLERLAALSSEETR